ncbi:MAG TPA: ABC transporter permease [Puia sp.]|nr:ABC transporter permease [Puia sp.]
MFKNYFKIALRNIIKHKVYSAINILGLFLGICSCIIIYLISSYEFSFDSFHLDNNRLYRIVGEIQAYGLTIPINSIPSPAPLAIRNEIAGINEVAEFNWYWAKIEIPIGANVSRKFEGKIENGRQTSIIICEPQYFNIFKYKWLAGNASNALREPNKVVLLESRAKKYFGSEPFNKMIGREVIYNDSLHVTVSGIVKDWNENTDFPATDFISFASINSSFLKNDINLSDWITEWGKSGSLSWCLVRLNKDISSAKIDSQLKSFTNKYWDSHKFNISFHLQPLLDIHFNDIYKFRENEPRKANKVTLRILIGVASFILIIALINFINLSLAQSFKRVKEIGIRKVLGSRRINIIYQLLAETFIITVCATIISVFLVKSILNVFHAFIPEGVKFEVFSITMIIFLSLVIFATTTLAGLYPAIKVSSYLTLPSLKGTIIQKGEKNWHLRKGLIALQFTISLIFIICSIVIAKQLNFIKNNDLGFNAADVVTIKTPYNDIIGKEKILANGIEQMPGVKMVAFQSFSPLGDAGDLLDLKYRGKKVIDMTANIQEGNDNFIPLYQIRLLAGRNIFYSDSLKELVLNESLAKMLGFNHPEDAIGKILIADNKPCSVVGVIKDYHETSLYNPIFPICIGHIPTDEKEIAIRFNSVGKMSNNIQNTLYKIEKLWKTLYPKATFQYSFLDESIASFYEKEQKTIFLLNIAMSIAIFISCLGLFGLSMFIAELKTKEISIRKVLGATTHSIVIFLSRPFISLVAIAILIASPIAWYFMTKWLQNFAYRINISWWIFLLSGFTSFLIAAIAIGFQSIKAALQDPVNILRTE